MSRKRTEERPYLPGDLDPVAVATVTSAAAAILAASMDQTPLGHLGSHHFKHDERVAVNIAMNLYNQVGEALAEEVNDRYQERLAEVKLQAGSVVKGGAA